MNLLRDPVWQSIGVVVSIILSLFADASVITKVVLCVAILGAFFLFRKQTSGAVEKEGQVDVTPPKATNPVDISSAQDTQIFGRPQVPRPHPSMALIEEGIRKFNRGYVSPASHANIAPAATEKPGDIDSAHKIEEKSSSFSWKDRVWVILVCAIVYGIPGILLFRSSIQWQHIVGIVILVFLGVGVIGNMLPESWTS